MKCPYCKAELSFVSYATSCPSCGKSLHTCKACKYYSPNEPYGCHEHIDEPVVDKDHPNFCDFYSLTDKEIDNKTSSKKAEDIFNSFFSV